MGSHKEIITGITIFKVDWSEVLCGTDGTKCSRMDQVKFV